MMGDPRYPNSQCDLCGWGLNNDKTCPNSDCPPNLEPNQITLGWLGDIDRYALTEAIREVMQAHGIAEDDWDIINVE